MLKPNATEATGGPLKPKYILSLAVSTTGVRFCRACRTLYAAAAALPNPIICPACRSDKTAVQQPGELPPNQTVFFRIPPAPAPNAWVVEWRWAKKPHGPYRGQRPETGWCWSADETINPWQRYSTYNVTCHRTAKNQRGRLSKIYPYRSFRVTPVSWHAQPLHIHPDLPDDPPF